MLDAFDSHDVTCNIWKDQSQLQHLILKEIYLAREVFPVRNVLSGASCWMNEVAAVIECCTADKSQGFEMTAKQAARLFTKRTPSYQELRE